MAKFGDAFSDDERRKAILRQLQPGLVIYLDVAFAEGPRSKYLVVAHVDAEYCTFVVNSQINPFVAARAELAICQVRLDAARHTFLRHDSFIACHQVLRLPTESVLKELIEDMSRINGPVHPDVVDDIIAAVKRAPTLSVAEQTRIANALASGKQQP